VRGLGRLLAAPPEQLRERPPELLWWNDERPPAGVLVGLGLQHALLTLMLCLYAVIAARAAGLTGVAAATYTTGCVALLGLNAILQGGRSRLTPGVLLIPIPNPITLGTYVAVVGLYGIGAAAFALVVAQLALIPLARALPRLRPVFPPEVIGVAVFMLGVSLVEGGVLRSLGLENEVAFAWPHLLSAGVCLAGIVACTVWGTPRLRIVSVLVGVTLGTAVALLSDPPGEAALDLLATLPVVDLPLVGDGWPAPIFVPSAVVAIFLTELITAMDQFASALTLDRMNNAAWRRADMSLVSRSVIANAIANIGCGLAGTLSAGASTASIGLAAASRVTSRHVAVAAGLVLLVVACLPPLAGLIVLTPESVVGGVLVYTAAFMMVTGMDLILSRMLNSRRTFTVGLSIAIGLAVMLLPDVLHVAPLWSQPIVESGLAVGALAAVLLNLLFRIGVSRRVGLPLSGADAGREAADALEKAGRDWGARREVVQRAALAVGQTVEVLQAEALLQEPTVGLDAAFDEFPLVCTLSYRGAPLPLDAGAGSGDLEAVMAEDGSERMDRLIAGLLARLIRRLANGVGTRVDGDRVQLQLRFEH